MTEEIFMQSPYRVERRSIDAGHGCSCPDVYEIRNDQHYVCELSNETTANWLVDRLNDLRNLLSDKEDDLQVSFQKPK